MSALSEKIEEIREEMKRVGTWKSERPDWVKDFGVRRIGTGNDFSEWLQFVYLPNLLQSGWKRTGADENQLIVPQAIRYYSQDVRKGRLLQLLIELDSL